MRLKKRGRRRSKNKNMKEEDKKLKIKPLVIKNGFADGGGFEIKKDRENYLKKEIFIKKATAAGFTDDQAEFLYRVCFDY